MRGKRKAPNIPGTKKPFWKNKYFWCGVAGFLIVGGVIGAFTNDETSTEPSIAELETQPNENRRAIVEEAKRKNEERLAQRERALQEQEKKESKQEEPDPVDEDQIDYLWIVDTSPREMKIHYPDCELAPEKGAMNRYETDLSTESLNKDGYTPCDHCFNWDWEELWDSYDSDQSSEYINPVESDPLASPSKMYLVNTDTKKLHREGNYHTSNPDLSHWKEITEEEFNQLKNDSEYSLCQMENCFG